MLTSPDPSAGATRSAALDFRARLSARQPDAARRHAARLGTRIGVLLISDVLALLIARSALGAIVTHPVLSGRWPSDLTASGPLARPGDPGSMVFYIALIIALAFTGSYTRHRGLNTGARLGAGVAIAILFATVPLAAVVGVPRAFASTLLVGLTAWAALLFARLLFERFLEGVWPRDRWAAPAIFVGPPEATSSTAAAAVCRPGGDYAIAAHHCIADGSAVGDPRSLAASVRDLIDKNSAEAVVLSEPLPEPYVRALLDTVLETGCQLLYPARAVRIENPRPRLVWHHDQPFFELGAPVLKITAVAMKRAMDLILSSMLLFVAAPLMLVVAIAIKLDSRGPVFFRQHRAGRGGGAFNMLKFRTMRVGADDEKQRLAHLNHTGDVRLFKIPGDPRVTRIGAFLRRWSLDELPQLWNVVRGDMSLVGPRPFFESDFAAYEDHHFRRLDTKPGITGLWQVSGRSEVVDFEDVVFLDRQYIEQWSVWLDVSILVRTISAVARRTGAY